MSLDWAGIFQVSVHPLELFIRASAIYWFLFTVFRIVLRRDLGAIGIADVLLVVLIAEASQNAMAGEHRSITEGLIVVATIVGWNVAIDALAYRFPLIQRIAQPPELLLVHNGQILHRNLRRELITVDDLKSKLRQHGIDDLAEVRAANLESDGEVSVVRRDPAPVRRPDVAPRKRH